MKRARTARARLTALFAGLFAVTTSTVLVAVNLLLDRIVSPDTIHSEGTLAPPGTPVPDHARLGLYDGSAGDLPPPAFGNLQIALQAYHWTLTWVAAAVLAVVGAAAGWWLAGRVLRPVHQITATARRLSLSSLHERIALRGPDDELKELADTFDAMLDRLERAADSQRRFAANASHELRTPLAIQRAVVEIGLEDPTPDQLVLMRQELLDANRRTESLVEGLLALAQGQRGPERHESVDMAALAREAADQHRVLAADAGVGLDLVLARAHGTGDPALLLRLIANLVHNGIRYNYPGGYVRVHVAPDTGVTVTNTGPHVPADRMAEMFEPFRRLDPHRTAASDGAGLGLSIVAAIAESHGARVDARPNPDGGLTVNVAFPALCAASGPPATGSGAAGEGSVNASGHRRLTGRLPA